MSDKTTIDPVTDKERATWPKEPIVELEKPFDDVRGSIKPLVDMLMKSAVLIASKKPLQPLMTASRARIRF